MRSTSYIKPPLNKGLNDPHQVGGLTANTPLDVINTYDLKRQRHSGMMLQSLARDILLVYIYATWKRYTNLCFVTIWQIVKFR